MYKLKKNKKKTTTPNHYNIIRTKLKLLVLLLNE